MRIPRIPLFAAGVLLLGALVFGSQASACEQSTVDCGPGVPDATYHGGDVELQTVQATACFTQVIAEAITLADGRVEFTVVLVYNPATGAHEVIRSEDQVYCWTQNVQPGTWMAVFVTCQEHTGWVAVMITGPGQYVMTPQSWGFAEH